MNGRGDPALVAGGTQPVAGSRGPVHAEVKRGRVYDQVSRRWYKDGYAPFQLPEFITAWCLRCGNETLTISVKGAVCATCSPVTRAD
jgi:hypothetical protein